MKTLYLVANWKSNKLSSETKEWFERMANSELQMVEHKVIVVCPPYSSLPQAKLSTLNSQLSIHLGAQDVSPFGAGAYTGEVHAKQVKEFGDYVIIGHSERRQNFAETDDLLAKKVAIALQEGLTPIFCVQGKETAVPEGVTIVAYEPVSAIGTGNPDTPENAEEVARALREAHPQLTAVLYGGSVKPENVATFTTMEHISGVLVGGASLDAGVFAELIRNS